MPVTDIRTPPDPEAAAAALFFGDDDPAIGYNRVFFALQRIQRTMMPAIERKLRELGIADPIWYEIIEAAEKAGPGGIQMLALQKRLFVQQYALSRHVSRMVKAGLVRSEATGGAGRARVVCLTEASQGLQKRIWLVYAAQIQAAFGPRISQAEAYRLVRMLNRLYD